MSLAYYIVLDQPDPGFDTFVNGKFLAHEEGLDAFCTAHQLPICEDFLSVSAEDLEDFFGDDPDATLPLPDDDNETAWFSAEEGLSWVARLSAQIAAHPEALANPQGCLDDLAEYTAVLTQAQASGARWHLKLDI
jgi:hypothetical protein